MVDAFIAAGGKYFDTAYIYEGSEEATKAALCDRYPRESYYLADKLNASDFAAKSKEEAKNEIRVSLERTGAGYIDFYLLHGIDEGNIRQSHRGAQRIPLASRRCTGFGLHRVRSVPGSLSAASAHHRPAGRGRRNTRVIIIKRQ